MTPTHAVEAKSELLEKRDEIAESHVLKLSAADTTEPVPVPQSVVLLERGKTRFAAVISRSREKAASAPPMPLHKHLYADLNRDANHTCSR